MCYIYSMLDNSVRPIDQYKTPKMLNRFAAAAVDLAFYILLSFLILTIIGFFTSREGTPYDDASLIIAEQIKSSKLAKSEEKSGYVLYSSEEYRSLDDEDRPLIIDHISYFYCSYLTGENIEEGLSASLDKDEKVVEDGITYTSKEYYTVAYFNEKILGLPKTGETNESRYFIYKEEAGVIDYTQIGIVNPDYIETVNTGDGFVKRLKNDSGLLKFINDFYQESVNVFFNQKTIKSSQETMNRYNIMIMLVATMPTLAVFYFLLPLLSPFGQTLGKRFLSLAVVDDRGYLIKKWQILLRNIPILGVTIFVCLINNLYFQLIVPLFFLLISTGILVFNERRRCLHDLMARTTVVKMNKGMIIYPDEEHFEQAQAIIKERDGVSNDGEK